MLVTPSWTTSYQRYVTNAEALTIMSNFQSELFDEVLRLKNQLTETTEVFNLEVKNLLSHFELVQGVHHQKLLTLNRDLKLLSSKLYPFQNADSVQSDDSAS